MLEARLENAVLIKRLLDSIKELVTDANFKAEEEEIALQAMDNSHVALVAVSLRKEGFKQYRCDRPLPLGVNLNSLTKVLKCAKDDDIVTLKASDDADVLNLTYEAARSDRIAEYDMKLMDIDSEQLGIPDTDYDCSVTMPSAELARIVRDLSQLGESVRIEVSKDGVRFASEGEAANGKVLLKQTDAAKKKYAEWEKSINKQIKKEKIDGDEDDEEEEDQEEGSSKRKTNGTQVKKEQEDKEMDVDVDAEEAEDGNADGEEEKPDSDEEEEAERESKKRKRAQRDGGRAKKAKKGEGEEDEGQDGVAINMSQHVALTFSLKYLVNFAKSSSLSDTVKLEMSNDVPLLVTYHFNAGFIKYYLAPKIGDE